MSSTSSGTPPSGANPADHGLALVVIGVVLRFGYAADELWALAAMVLPFSPVFYPVAALPGWTQTAATIIPPTHVFEAMRGLLADRGTLGGNLWTAGMLDVVYLGAAFAFARTMFGTFRRRGRVTRYV